MGKDYTCSERSPLLGEYSYGSRNEARKPRNRLHLYVPIVLLVTIIAVFFIRVEPNIGVGVASGTSFNTDDIQIIGIGRNGVLDLQITGTNTNNFTNIDDPYIRNYFKTGGFLLRKLNLKIDALDLVVHDDAKDEDIFLGVTEFKPFKVDIVDHSSTSLDLFVTLHPNSKGVLEILKKLITNRKSSLRLNGNADVQVYILNSYISVKTSIPLNIEF